MGRAYEVRKRKVAKTDLAKTKLYSIYAKDMYTLAKKKGTDLNINLDLKRLVDKAKMDQVPNDLIKRALDRATKGKGDEYKSVRYEAFGPSSSVLIIDCVTDNTNRTISVIRNILAKNKAKLGAPGSVSHLFEHLSIISFIDDDEDAVLEVLIEADLNLKEIKKDQDMITLYGIPSEFDKLKQVLINYRKDIVFNNEMVTLLPYQQITLNQKEKEVFEHLLESLDNNEDVEVVFHNVKLI